MPRGPQRVLMGCRAFVSPEALVWTNRTNSATRVPYLMAYYSMTRRSRANQGRHDNRGNGFANCAPIQSENSACEICDSHEDLLETS